MADYGKVPSSATLKVKPFKAHVEEQILQDFRDLLRLSPIGPAVFENTSAGRRYGMQRDWFANAKKVWENEFDWREHEDRINSFPNFTANVTDSDGNDISVHFLALFSEKPDAIPIGFFHGWPGSILEFLDLLGILKKRYSPEDLPYHVIVPSLPGYAYSSSPPLDRDYTTDLAADAMDKLMVGLGFGSGYLAQGGDIGSHVCRILAARYDACKGMHLNMIAMAAPENKDELHVDELEKTCLPNGDRFFDTASAYALEHGTRTATIGLALSSSPMALLSWIGEKFLEWTDEDPPLEQILESVTLYWLTDTFPRCIYPYRGNGNPESKPRMASMQAFVKRIGRSTPYVEKPCGYSLFPCDLFPVPKSWAATLMNLVSYSQHERGGHFAAMEKPKELLADVEDWIPKAWKRQGSYESESSGIAMKMGNVSL